MASPDLPRLALRVKKRRLELGLARNTTAVEYGMSKSTWKRVEEGLPVREMNYAKIERALLWATGSCVRILEGGDPIPIERSEAGSVDFASVPADDMEGEIRQAVQNAMVAGTNLTADRIREVNEIAIELLKKRGILPMGDES
jgi:hypothetical protein